MLLGIVLFLYGLSIGYALPEVWPLPNADFGAHIFKIDAEDIANDIFDLVHAVLLKYKFVVIRDQKNLTIDGLRRFSQRLGALYDPLPGLSHYPGYSDVDVISNVEQDDSLLTGLLRDQNEHDFRSDFAW